MDVHRLLPAVIRRLGVFRIALVIALVLAFGFGTHALFANPIVTLQLNASDSPIIEGDTGSSKNVTFTVSLSQAVPSGQSVTVTMTTLPGNSNSATVGTDYTAVTTPLTFNPGETTKTYTVTIIGDDDDELNEAFIVRATITASTIPSIDPPVGSSVQTTVIIYDDDNPTVASISAPSAYESDGHIDFVVTLSAASALEDISIAYKTVDGTAVAGSDYTSTSNGTLLIPLGNLSGTISIPVLTDALVEADETFQLVLLPDQSLSVSTPFLQSSSVGTIKNASLAPTDISLAPDSILENNPANSLVGAFGVTDPDNSASFSYALVSGTGDDDNGAFTITGNQLFLTAAPDYEAQSSYSIRVEVTDSEGNTYQESLAITVTNVNETPTDLDLSAISIAENQPAGTAVGNFTATDPDVGDTFTYALVAGTGDTGNGSFTIVGDALQTAAVFDYETQNSYSIRVQVTDSGGNTYEKAFTITVTDSNDAPTDIALSATGIAENQPAGTAVGNFTATDPDVGDTFTYALVSGTGDTDNSAFTIAGDALQTAAVFDYEAQSSYSIRVKVTDSGGNTYEKAFTITVTDTNDAPTDIALSATSIAENQPAGTVVGNFTATDPDVGDTFTYTLVAGTGDTDNSAFTIVGNALQTATILDFETQNSYSIRVQVSDSGGLTYEEVFTVTVTNVNEDPTDLDLSVTSIAENQPAGTAVGNFTATDPDVGDTFTYALVAGTGDTDNSAFTIVGDALQTAAVFDYETQNSYSIRVQVTDGGGLTYEEVFTITITDGDDAPTLTNNGLILNEGATANITTIQLNANDSDTSAINLIFTVTALPANGSLTKSSVALAVNSTFTQADLAAGLISYTHDGSETTSDSFTFTLSDGTTSLPGQIFSITITPVNDVPTLTNNGLTVNEGASATITTAALSASDSDTSAVSLIFTVTALPVNGTLEKSGTPLVVNDTFTQADLASGLISYTHDGSETTSDSFIFTLSDGIASLSGQIFTITVTPTNDAPTDISLTATTVDENQPAGTTVGTFSATDADVSDTFTYALVAGTGDTGNGSFTISGNTLQTSAILDYEAQSSYSIRVQVTDGGGLTYEKVFTITVNDLSDPPTNLTLSANSIAENQAVGTTVGTFSADDQDSVTLTYSLVTGTGDDDNASFTIVGDELQTTAIFNYETQSSYSIRVQVSDGTLTEVKQFTITVTNVNEVPTLLSLSPLTVAENVAIGSEVGTFTTTDPDTGDTFTYTFVSGTGDTDNDSFAISGNKLQTAVAIDFETKSSYSIRVRSTDSGGLYVEETFTITVTDVNEAPVVDANGAAAGINYAASYTEQAAATVIIDAGATVTDADSSLIDTIVVTIVDLEDDTTETLAVDTSSYPAITPSYIGGMLTITGGPSSLSDMQAVLRTLTYANTSDNPGTSRTITIVATDNGTPAESSATATITLTITETDDAPTLTNNGLTVNEGTTANITTAQLSAADVDTAAANLVFTVTTLPTNGVLKKNGIALAANGTFTQADLNSGLISYTHDGSETPSTDSFTFSLSDGTTSLTGQTFAITIVPENDAPVVTLSSGATSYTLGATPVLIDPAATVSDSDSTDFDGGELRVTLAAPATGDVLSVKHSGTAAGQIGVSGTSISYGGTVIGTLSGGTASTPLVISLNSSATPAATQALAQAITFANASLTASNAARVVIFQVGDGDGLQSVAVGKMVTINTPPVAVNDSLNLTKNTTKAVTVLENDTDVDGDTLLIQSVTQGAHGTVTVSADNKTLIYAPVTDYTGTDSFTYTISDGKGGTATATVNVSVKEAVFYLPAMLFFSDIPPVLWEAPR